jgi:hypothetical protein
MSKNELVNMFIALSSRNLSDAEAMVKSLRDDPKLLEHPEWISQIGIELSDADRQLLFNGDMREAAQRWMTLMTEAVIERRGPFGGERGFSS